ncbi:MAG: hypothetical protein PVG65_01995 [Candidatus Thorarchaeota archaeon]|jgi:hypothetical protein
MARPKSNKKVQKLGTKYIAEYLSCKVDFEYFCRKYIKIELPGKDEVLSPYKKQSELIRKIEKEKYVLVLKSRQIGISTIIQAYTAWLVVFYDNVVVGIISKDHKEATDFARAARGMVEKLPDWMKPSKGVQGRGFAKRTEQSFILTNGAKVYASPVNPNKPDATLRGKHITFLVIDEAAFVGYVEEAWTSIVPALSTNQMQAKRSGVPYGTIILSTPNKTVGIGKWYFEQYSRAVSNDDIFKPFVIHWKMIEELKDDPDWYKTQCALFDHDPRKIAQELELKFLPAEGAFFEAETMEKVQSSIKEPIAKLKIFNGEVWEFEKPIPNQYYMIGVDTAPEHGQDKSAITVWNYETLEQVWEYQGKCKILDFVKVVQIAARSYPGIIIIESTGGYGNQVLEELSMTEFSSMIYKEKRNRKSSNTTLVPGISNNAQTRPLIIDALYSYITQYPESIRSTRLALELTGLVSKTSGKVEADRGCHDDLALATACCMYVRKYDPPTLIDKTRFVSVSSDIRDIMTYNEVSDVKELTNSDVLNKVKENLDEKGGLVDIMNFYSRE